ncbi:MAG TPA: PIG-L family deacetylase, partial [Rhodanobacteraceae bacterium]|nr:PIG-L family deacetylase [Rhodanobacteraceae bacterium]
MTRTLRFQATDRLLVFAPHPDDETIATGEMIQFALAAGANVRVVFATDGDNNPWPQRWCERRWRIGVAERERWGHRRRGEAVAALARLGVSAESARFLGWPDLGLTEKLMRDDRAIETLAAEIDGYAPTHVAMPSLRDRHPDHGALRVMLELALRRARAQCLCFGYVVHGRSDDSDEWELARDAQRHSRKREALTEHASQIALSERRLLRWASQNESFEQAEPRGASAAGAAAIDVLVVPLVPRYRFWRRHDVLLVLVDGPNIERA